MRLFEALQCLRAWIGEVCVFEVPEVEMRACCRLCIHFLIVQPTPRCLTSSLLLFLAFEPKRGGERLGVEEGGGRKRDCVMMLSTVERGREA